MYSFKSRDRRQEVRAAATVDLFPAHERHNSEEEAAAAAAAATTTLSSAHMSPAHTHGRRATSDVDEAEVVDGDQWTDESLKGLKKKELKAILAGLGLKKTGNKDDLVDRILGRETVEKRKKKPKWRNSKARAMLVRMLMDQNSNAQEMTWQQLYASHEWFQEYDSKSFRDYVRELKKANPKKLKIVTEDNMIIKAELKNFPRPEKTNRGQPFWDTHPAKLLLREDVKVGKHLEMKPHILHQTRPEYKAFNLKTFRQHVYQEKRHQKELPMRVARRNKKAQYKYDKEVKENIALWKAKMNVDKGDDEEFDADADDQYDDDDEEEIDID